MLLKLGADQIRGNPAKGETPGVFSGIASRAGKASGFVARKRKRIWVLQSAESKIHPSIY